MRQYSGLARILSRSLLLGALLAVSACTTTGSNKNNTLTASVDNDPIEPWNRTVFQLNRTVDGTVLKPVTLAYRWAVPAKGQEMVHNFITNLYTPVVFANSVLQLDPQNSFSSFWRFFVNTAFGIGGLFDVASETDLKVRETDLGQTFAMYGADTGPYLVLPIIGPSNARDALGRIGDAFINPFNHVDEGASYVLWSTTAVDRRSINMKLIDDIYATSLDPYSTFRSAYTQKRSGDIRRALTEREKAWDKAGFKD